MGAWNSFFQAELGAAAALAGLLFVAVSVNQTRILELGRMADRGFEALAMLFLVLVVASLPLIPGQPVRLLGGEILAVATGTLAALVPVQIGYLHHVDPMHRPNSTNMVRGNRLAMAAIRPWWPGARLAGRPDGSLPFGAGHIALVHCRRSQCVGATH